MFEDIIKPGIVLFVIAAVMVGTLAFINSSTENVIAKNRSEEKKEAMNEVLPEMENSHIENEIVINYLEDGNPNNYTEDAEHIYSYSRYLSEDELVGYAVISQSKGYGGKILIVVGMDTEGTVLGVKLIEQSETPGLGANAADKNFTDKFVDKAGILSVTKSPSPKENEIDAITAATITSEAVVDGVNYAVMFFENNLKGAD